MLAQAHQTTAGHRGERAGPGQLLGLFLTVSREGGGGCCWGGRRGGLGSVLGRPRDCPEPTPLFPQAEGRRGRGPMLRALPQ